MKRIVSRKPSPAFVLSLAALFVALSGTAVALKANSVASKHIKDDAIKSEDIKDEKGVKGVDLATNAIPHDGGFIDGSTKVANDAVGRDEIGASSVSSDEISIDSVGPEELEPVVIRPGEPTTIVDTDGGDENWSGNTAGSGCELGEQLLSGYAEWTDGSGGDDTATAEVILNPSTDNVVVRGIQNTGDAKSVRAVAVCLTF